MTCRANETFQTVSAMLFAIFGVLALVKTNSKEFVLDNATTATERLPQAENNSMVLSS